MAPDDRKNPCADHLARGSSKQEFSPGHMSIGAHHQKIRAFFDRRLQKLLPDAESGMQRHPDVTRLDVVPGEILDRCMRAVMMLITNRNDESFARSGKKGLCSGQGADRLSGAIPAE